MEPLLIVVLIVLFGLIFDYTNGFHDAANVVSTVIATRVLTPTLAIVMAATLNTVGATHLSGVAATIAEGLVRIDVSTTSMILSALFGAIIWNLLTWYFGVPSSSSYALIGGMIGAALFQGGTKDVLWQGLAFKVLIPMVFSPFIGFFFAFILMKLLSGMRNTRVFHHLQIASASIVALAHGLNDAQKSMGIITLGLYTTGVLLTIYIPWWVILACALTMGLGTAFGGFRIINTVGFRITKMEPMQGFAAEMSSAVVILTASFLGMPLSSTQMIVGSVTGVGASKGKRHIDMKTLQKIALAWIITLPGSAVLSVFFYWILNIISRF